MTIRSRFAPSPTGVLHVGSVRTALFAWAFAQKKGGDYVLRIEDTDLTRSTKESVDAILAGLDWLGLMPKEAPIFQTERFSRYEEVLQNLFDKDLAYYCECSKERLDTLREKQIQNKEKPKYDGCCRNKNLQPNGDKPMVVRFKTPLTGSVGFSDLVYGDITIDNQELDDLIIKRSDGSPTYNFCVVVDDSDMNISHVIRGDDHINNTPKQIHLYKAMDKAIPVFAHLPMILGSDGKRLSKRHGAVGVEEFKHNGILPEALINYLVRLGWSHGDKEIFSRDEITELFSLEQVGKSNATFDYDKLLWINQHYLKTLPLETYKTALIFQFEKANLSLENGPSLEKLAPVMAERVQTLKELVENSIYFYTNDYPVDEAAKEKFITDDKKPLLKELKDRLANITNWQASEIDATIKSFLEEKGLKFGKLGPALRIATSGTKNSPSLDVMLELIGQSQTLHRLDLAS